MFAWNVGVGSPQVLGVLAYVEVWELCIGYGHDARRWSTLVAGWPPRVTRSHFGSVVTTPIARNEVRTLAVHHALSALAHL